MTPAGTGKHLGGQTARATIGKGVIPTPKTFHSNHPLSKPRIVSIPVNHTPQLSIIERRQLRQSNFYCLFIILV
jgi:hypothetical protein